MEQGSRQAAGREPLRGPGSMWAPASLRMALLQASTHLVRVRVGVRVRVVVRARARASVGLGLGLGPGLGLGKG